MNNQTAGQSEPSIEIRELRGVNLKNLITVVSATVVICTAVLTSKSSIEQKIHQLEIQKQGDDKYIDLRIRTLEMKMSAIELQLKEIANRMETNKL